MPNERGVASLFSYNKQQLAGTDEVPAERTRATTRHALLHTPRTCELFETTGIFFGINISYTRIARWHQPGPDGWSKAAGMRQLDSTVQLTQYIESTRTLHSREAIVPAFGKR